MYLSNLKLLKGTVEGFGKISVTDDYTSHEREQIKSWVKIAAKKSEEDSDKVYKVRGDEKNGLRLVSYIYIYGYVVYMQRWINYYIK